MDRSRARPGAVFVDGERVTLRTLEEADLEFVHEGVNHPDVRTLVGQSFPTSRHRERRYFEEANDSLETIAVVIWDDDTRVGVVEFDAIDRETGSADLAVWVHPERHRKGYAREAISLFVDYAFSELRLHRVSANAYDANERSRAILEDLGFTEEGVGREDAFFDGAYHDTHYFGVLASEWRG